MEAYLDNSATTKCRKEVAEIVTHIMCEDYGNPSSLHTIGMQAEQYIKDARNVFASLLKVHEKEIYFTSGGTESNNLALLGAALANKRSGNHIITSKIEHPSVLEACKHLEDLGFELSYVEVDVNGLVQLDSLQRVFRSDTILVSIMHTNNEIGTVQPIAEIGEWIKSKNETCLFHVDAVQGFGKARIYPKKMKIDLLAASSHKIHGPKGVGLLYVGAHVKMHAIMFGGGQQKGLRQGTENVPGIAGMTRAAYMIYSELEEDMEQLYGKKEYFLRGLSQIERTQVNGMIHSHASPHIISLSVEGVRSEVLLHALEEKGIYVSAGSACASNHPKTSETLKAIKLQKHLWDSTIRFSMSSMTTIAEIDYTLETLYDMIPMLRKFTRRK